jgi:tetrapyrrole methylase family protein/MazG family protein
MTREAGAFDIHDVAAGLDDKLIRRHPHVFGDQQANSEETAFQTWEKQKAKEKAAKAQSGEGAGVLDGVPKGLPALQKAARIIEKVTKVGFQWNDMQGPLEKVEEELGEMKQEVLALEHAVRAQKAGQKSEEEIAAQRERLGAEIGDLLFTLANVSYLMKVNPEDALRGTLARFESRFRHVERRLREAGKTPDQSDLTEMDRYWNEAKAAEKRNDEGQKA